MLNLFLTKLKVFLKRLIGKVVYAYTYISGFIPMFFTQLKKQNTSTFITSITKKWKTSLLILSGILLLYYGIGALVSSNINKTLNQEIKLNTSKERYSTAFIIHTLKSQIDDTPWTPSLPPIFPASILDNLPNFQLGSKNANLYIIKKLSALYLNDSLKNATELLKYPENIWLFSQGKDDKLLPGSAKQYRKAINEIKNFSKTEALHHPLTPSNFVYQLDIINSLLSRQIEQLEKHILEYSTDLTDISADNLFYYTQGTLYTVHYYLSGLTKDYQALIVENDLYDDITTILHILNKAVNLKPIIIKNSPLEDTYGANHLTYLAYFISKSQNLITKTSYSVKKTYLKD